MKATSNPESEAIRNRFFEAIGELKKKYGLTLAAYSRRYNLDPSNVAKLKAAGRQPIPGWYLAVLVKDYAVSSEWLLLGEGTIFGQ
ncbi:hypothetical protein DYBT9623_04397 [Dyadobacter sp. CECT 9623]|uniref:Uncharacterized protein n=1 Tax=Dyadobacter linearis TaxID=2823330 RepID=A0ABM8UVN2_9BACT|nr:hypothetical protein [Dyadobacter sp. CECT 9623]CAG5072856.1 hypothetical protein DYBT9623_04397 [Dyadobacter sp. CECT 9623]